MRAAVQHAYGLPQQVVHVEEVPVPAVGAGEVLVAVRAAGVNWADTSMTIGQPYLMRLGYGLRRPRRGVRGTDVAGTVVAVGADVTGFASGDAVFGWCTAAFAEYVVVPAGQLVAKPADLSFEHAAGVPMAGCVALQALRAVARTTAGDRVLVNGASGGIGTFLVQIAKARGAVVTAVCSTPNLDLVALLGADHVIDYTERDFTEGDERYDLVFDIADRLSLSRRRRVLTHKGVLIPNSGVGGPWFGSLGRILKAWLVSPFVSQKLHPFLSMAKADDLHEIVDLIEAGSVSPVVGATYGLAEAGEAIARAGSGHARGKVVVTVD